MGRVNMIRFLLKEISGVDRPAQVGARAVIMKRDDTKPVEKRLRMLDDVDGHTHLLDDSDEGGHTSHDPAKGEEFGHSHAWIRQQDGTLVVGMADGHTHSVLAKRASSPDVPASAVTKGTAMTPEEKKAADELTKRLEKAEKSGARTAEILKLRGPVRDHFDKIEGDEAQDAFLALDAPAQNAAVEKVNATDPVVYTCTDGTPILKSHGAIVEKQARDNDTLREELRLEKAAREDSDFAKRAETELNKLPGKPTAKVALLRAVEKIDSAEDRVAVRELLKAANGNMSKAFVEKGTQEGSEAGSESAERQIAKRVAEVSKTESITKVEAYKAFVKTDEGRELVRLQREEEQG